MKKIKTLTGIACGALMTFLASPAAVMAATEEVAEKRSLGETMQIALLNTVMSITIVFAALILIAWIIGLFKYINKFEQKLAARKAAKNAPAETEAPEPVVEAVEEEDLSADLELVAVITAAIHAYEEAQGNNVPADALVVRSIRKVNKNKWQNA